jgi:hypothetical protein
LRLCEKKRKKNSSQSRECAKKGYFFFSVSLPVVGGPVFLCGSASLREKKEKNKSRKVGKPPRPPAVIPSAPQFLCVSAPLREEKEKNKSRKVGKAQRRGIFPFPSACLW